MKSFPERIKVIIKAWKKAINYSNFLSMTSKNFSSLLGYSIIFHCEWLEKSISLIKLILFSLFKECFMKPEHWTIKENIFCIISVVNLLTAK